MACTRFNTGNPVLPCGSPSAKDLSDNAPNLDLMANDLVNDTFTDRLGNVRDTANGRIKKMGYTVPIVYAGGELFAINDNVKTIEEGDIVYAPLPSALPFTTSGTWGVIGVSGDNLKFFVVQGLTADNASSFLVNKSNTVAELLLNNNVKDGGATNVKNRTTGNKGSAMWDASTGLVDNGLDILQSSVDPLLFHELRKNPILDAMQFGNIATNAKNMIERMVQTGNNLYLPSGEYDAAALNVISLNKKIVIHGDTPVYDPLTDTKTGTWINGVLSSAGAKSIAMFDIGVDTRLVAENEGVIFSDPQYMDTVFIDRVIVIAKPNSNHCLLIENTKRVDVGTVILYGGIQGFAIKAEVFKVGAIFAFDQATWGCTVRYSPSAPCNNGYIGYVYCGTVNNAKGGGVICMNDQEGAALKNVNFGKIIIDQGSAGFFITNGGNTVDAENITVDDLYIEGVSAFAIQTFGKPNGFKIGRAHLKNCSGSIFNNNGDPQDHEYSNITIEGGGAPALLSGDNHKCRGWNSKGAALQGTFIQNESIDLQVWDMDARSSAVLNQNGGTQYASGAEGGVNYPANGNLPAMVSLTGVKHQSSASLVTNDLTTVYALPAGSSKYILTLKIMMFSVAGAHSRTVQIAMNDIQYIANSSSASAVFSVEKNGDNIQVKYIFSAGGVDINCVIEAFHEA